MHTCEGYLAVIFGQSVGCLPVLVPLCLGGMLRLRTEEGWRGLDCAVVQKLCMCIDPFTRTLSYTFSLLYQA